MSSLKCWLRKVNKQDKISKEDLDEIFNRLDGHDKAIRADERQKFAKWLEDLPLMKYSPIYIPDLIQDYEKETK